jgi:uncharacterized protein
LAAQWFECDADKDARNVELGRMSFLTAVPALFDGRWLALSGREEHEERRDRVIGFVPDLGLVHVVYTERQYHGEKSIRIISVRKAHAKERRFYESR